MSKPKSRITVSRRQDGVAIRATGIYAQALVEALFGKISEEAPPSEAAKTMAPMLCCRPEGCLCERPGHSDKSSCKHWVFIKASSFATEENVHTHQSPPSPGEE